MEFIELDRKGGVRGKNDDRFASLFDAAYSMTVTDKPERLNRLIEHINPYEFPSVTVRRTTTSKFVVFSIWEQHASIARHALDHGRTRVLIMEDDVHFTVTPDTLAGRIDAALGRLPANWAGLYLGHFPLQAYPVAWGLTRVRTMTAHAYIANRPLLEWLAASHMSDRTLARDWWGSGIDGALAVLPNLYALLPMVAFQRPLATHRPDTDPKRYANGQVRPFWSPIRYRPAALWHGARIAEIITLAQSPLSALTLEPMRKRRVSRYLREMAALVKKYELDEEYYLAANPDVAACGMPAAWHYDRHGLKRGVRPIEWPTRVCPNADPSCGVRESCCSPVKTWPLRHTRECANAAARSIRNKSAARRRRTAVAEVAACLDYPDKAEQIELANIIMLPGLVEKPVG